MRLGALEAGGTKMICGVGNEAGEIYDQISIATESPEITIPKIAEYFRKEEIEALGIGCFGPVELDKSSKTYGYITSTPKTSWQNYNIVGVMKEQLGIPVGFDTDVNAAVLGEVSWGALRGLDSGLYITIGTGIGVGIYSENRLIHNMLHPEAGHLLIRPHAIDSFTGNCPYHGTCFEGMASGPAIAARYNKPAEHLSNQLEVWKLEAYYIAQALMNYILMVSPRRIVLGGGVMKQQQLFPLIRERVEKLMNGYIKTKELNHLPSYIVPSSLNGLQGLLGCLELAMAAK